MVVRSLRRFSPFLHVVKISESLDGTTFLMQITDMRKYCCFDKIRADMKCTGSEIQVTSEPPATRQMGEHCIRDEKAHASLSRRMLTYLKKQYRHLGFIHSAALGMV